MKKSLVLIAGLVILVPALAIAASANGQSATNGNSVSTSNNTANTGQSTAVSNSTTTQTQTQANNPGTGTQTQTQTQSQVRTEAQIQQDISESAPQYSPKNSKGIEQRSVVANAAQELIQTAAQIQNQGIGDQIRTIAQTQTKNQDKIGESIDKIETRSSFAKFFIGANFKELNAAKSVMVENQNQIKELQQIMTQLTNDADKVNIANQIITLQQTQLEIKDQIRELSGGFSLFGWINRWYNNF